MYTLGVYQKFKVSESAPWAAACAKPTAHHRAGEIGHFVDVVGQDQAAKLLSHLDDVEIREISQGPASAMSDRTRSHDVGQA